MRYIINVGMMLVRNLREYHLTSILLTKFLNTRFQQRPHKIGKHLQKTGSLINQINISVDKTKTYVNKTGIYDEKRRTLFHNPTEDFYQKLYKHPRGMGAEQFDRCLKNDDFIVCN